MLDQNRALEGVLIATQAAGVVAAIIIARSVGPAGRGTIVTVMIWGQLLGWLAALSLDQALIVLASGPEPVTAPDEGLKAARLPVLATSLLAVFASILLGRRLFSNGSLIAALAILAVATAQAELLAGWLLARGQRRGYICWRLLQPILYVSVVITIAIVLRNTSIEKRTIAMALGATASTVVPAAAFLLLQLRQSKAATGPVWPLLRFAAVAQIGSVLQYLNGRLDILTLTFLVSAKSLGYYSAGAAFGQLTLLLDSAGVVRGITGASQATDVVGLGIAAALAVVVILAAPIVVPIVFGPSFSASIPIARILAIGGVANYALQSACGRLLRRRQPAIVALSQGIGVVAFALGIFALRTINGVAWASVISFTIALIVAQIVLATSRKSDRDHTVRLGYS